MQKLTTPTDGENILIYGLLAFVVLIVIIYKLLVHNKRTVMRHNLAHERIIQTKNFAELIDVIESHEIRLQQGRLSDIIFTQFEKVVRKEFKQHKSREDYVEIVKLFDKISTSYRWNNKFDTPLYTSFLEYMLAYTKKLLDENQESERLFDNISILDKISLELESFFGAKMYYKEQPHQINDLRQRFYLLRRNLSEKKEGITAGA